MSENSAVADQRARLQQLLAEQEKAKSSGQGNQGESKPPETTK